jgi:hypothetical protein
MLLELTTTMRPATDLGFLLGGGEGMVVKPPSFMARGRRGLVQPTATIDGLERLVRGEPLRRVHECVFGVLALESEPVDPRL